LLSDSFSAEEESFAQGGLESKNRKLNRFNSMVQTPWYALSDFYRTAIKLLGVKVKMVGEISTAILTFVR